MPLTEPPLLDIQTTAALLGVDARTVRRMIKDGTLSHVRVGPGQTLIRVRRAELDKFLGPWAPPTTDHAGDQRDAALADARREREAIEARRHADTPPSPPDPPLVDTRGRRRRDLGLEHRPPADDEPWHPSESALQREELLAKHQRQRAEAARRNVFSHDDPPGRRPESPAEAAALPVPVPVIGADTATSTAAPMLDDADQAELARLRALAAEVTGGAISDESPPSATNPRSSR